MLKGILRVDRFDPTEETLNRTLEVLKGVLVTLGHQAQLPLNRTLEVLKGLRPHRARRHQAASESNP